MPQAHRSFRSLPAFLALALLAGSACIADTSATSKPRTPLDNVVVGYFDRVLELNPTLASYIGDYRYNDRLENNLGREWIEASTPVRKCHPAPASERP